MVAVQDNRIADRFCGMSLKVSLIFWWRKNCQITSRCCSSQEMDTSIFPYWLRDILSVYKFDGNPSNLNTSKAIGALGQLIIPIRNHIEYCDVNTDTTCRVISNNEFAGNLSISAFGILLVFMAIFGSIMNNNKFLIASLAIDAIQLIILPFVSWYILSSYENHDYGAVVEPLVNYAYMGIIMVYMILAISRYEEIKSSKMYPLLTKPMIKSRVLKTKTRKIYLRTETSKEVFGEHKRESQKSFKL